MTSAPSFRLLPVEATEAMRDAASAAVIAEWQTMIDEHRGYASVGDLARSFVSPGNNRLVLAAINAALSAAPVMLPEARCSQCDNGIELRWSYCPWCGEVGDWPDAPAALAIAAGQLGEKESGE